MFSRWGHGTTVTLRYGRLLAAGSLHDRLIAVGSCRVNVLAVRSRHASILVVGSWHDRVLAARSHYVGVLTVASRNAGVLMPGSRHVGKKITHGDSNGDEIIEGAEGITSAKKKVKKSHGILTTESFSRLPLSEHMIKDIHEIGFEHMTQNGTGVIIICPTWELAIQVELGEEEKLSNLLSKFVGGYTWKIFGSPSKHKRVYL